MVDSNERRRAPRKAEATPTPEPDKKAGAPRKPTNAQRAAPTGASNVRTDLSPEEIRGLIAEAAYYRAMERGFEPGHELEDWIEAEAEVMGRVSAGDR